MKPQAIASAILFAAVATLSVGAYAADAEKAPVKPHSHMEEKMDMTPPKAGAKAAPAEEKKADAAKAETKSSDKSKDKTRHLHPRDGKS